MSSDFLQKDVKKLIWTDQENGVAEGHLQLIQQRMSATLKTLFSARKLLSILIKNDTTVFTVFTAVYSSVYTRAGK